MNPMDRQSSARARVPDNNIHRRGTVILPRPIEPMLARPAPALPLGRDWLYEPKLDGFRAVVHFDGDHLHIDSRNGKPLDSYFPDLVASLPQGLPSPCVLDGELVIGRDDGLDFEELQGRLSRGRDNGRPLLGATYVAFDLLARVAVFSTANSVNDGRCSKGTSTRAMSWLLRRRLMTPKRPRRGCHSMLAGSRASSRSGAIFPTAQGNASWSRCDGCELSIVWSEATCLIHRACRPLSFLVCTTVAAFSIMLEIRACFL